jgi:6-phosphogluconolactonase
LAQSVSSLPDDFDATKNSTAHCEMTSDGRHFYVANRGHDSIAAFSIAADTGELTRISITPTEAVPRSFTITADGKYLYAAAEKSGRVAGYRIRESGSLEPIGVVTSGPISWAVLAVETKR